MKKALLFILLLLNSLVGMSQGNRAMDSLGREVKALGDTLATRNRDQVALGAAVERVDEKVSQYYDMFKHQWTVFGVVMTALSLVLVVMIPLAGLISFRSFRKEIADNTILLSERLASIEATVKENQEATKTKIVDLLEKVAFANRLINLNSTTPSFGYIAGFVSLKHFISCYLESPSVYFDNKIQEATTYLYLNWDDSPELRDQQITQAWVISQSLDLASLKTDGLLPETQEKLFRLQASIKNFMNKAAIVVKEL